MGVSTTSELARSTAKNSHQRDSLPCISSDNHLRRNHNHRWSRRMIRWTSSQGPCSSLLGCESPWIDMRRLRQLRWDLTISHQPRLHDCGQLAAPQCQPAHSERKGHGGAKLTALLQNKIKSFSAPRTTRGSIRMPRTAWQCDQLQNTNSTWVQKVGWAMVRIKRYKKSSGFVPK